MSISKKQIVMERIKEATKESRIAVFRASESGTYNAVFASTYESQRMIASKDSNLIGVFYGVAGAIAFEVSTKS